jgi:AcrR family transcriptional regulator
MCPDCGPGLLLVHQLDLVAPAPGLRERNKAEKWRRIVGSANRLFASQGFEATTTAAIAEEAGIGTGTLYLYVTSKEDLLVAVFRDEVGREWDAAFSQVDQAGPVLDQLLSVFGQVTAYHEREPALARIFFKELLFVSPAMRSGVTEFMRGFFAQLEGLLTRAQCNQLLEPEVPALTLAQNIYAQWYVLMQRRHTGTLSESGLLSSLQRGFAVSLWGMIPGISAGSLMADSDHL